MLRLSWQLRVCLGAASLVLLYDLIVLIALGSSSYMLPYLPSTVTLSCAGVSLVAAIFSLVYAFRASKLATLTPLVWLSLLHVALFTTIAVTAFLCAHEPDLVTELTPEDEGFLERGKRSGAYYPYPNFGWTAPLEDLNCLSPDNDMALKQRFDEAYCAKRGHVYCDSFPMRAVLRFGLINATYSTSSRIASASLNATFFDVPMTNSSTLTDFCGHVTSSVLAAEPTLSALCEGCQRTRETSALGDWIDDNCVRNTWVDGLSTFCIFYRSQKIYPELSPACRYAMMKPRFDTTFADVCYHTTFPAKVQRDANALAATAVALGVVSFVLASVLCFLQCSRDSVDEEDDLMYGALCDAERAATDSVSGDVVP